MSQEQAFILDLAILLQIDASEMARGSELASFDYWDSLAFVSVLAMADQHFSTKPQANALKLCTTVQDLVDIASGKRVA